MCTCITVYVSTLNPLKYILLAYFMDYIENSSNYFHLNWSLIYLNNKIVTNWDLKKKGDP